MLKSSAGNDQSVQTTTCAICGRSEVFTIVNSVVRAVVCGDLKSTSKYGSSSVAAGTAEPMSHVSSLFVDVGSSPLLNVALGVGVKRPPANAEPATSSIAATMISFFIRPPNGVRGSYSDEPAIAVDDRHDGAGVAVAGQSDVGGEAAGGELAAGDGAGEDLRQPRARRRERRRRRTRLGRLLAAEARQHGAGAEPVLDREARRAVGPALAGGDDGDRPVPRGEPSRHGGGVAQRRDDRRPGDARRGGDEARAVQRREHEARAALDAEQRLQRKAERR